jgi:hypothetical protein
MAHLSIAVAAVIELEPPPTMTLCETRIPRPVDEMVLVFAPMIPQPRTAPVPPAKVHESDPTMALRDTLLERVLFDPPTIDELNPDKDAMTCEVPVAKQRNAVGGSEVMVPNIKLTLVEPVITAL